MIHLLDRHDKFQNSWMNIFLNCLMDHLPQKPSIVRGCLKIKRSGHLWRTLAVTHFNTGVVERLETNFTINKSVWRFAQKILLLLQIVSLLFLKWNSLHEPFAPPTAEFVYTDFVKNRYLQKLNLFSNKFWQNANKVKKSKPNPTYKFWINK